MSRISHIIILPLMILALACSAAPVRSGESAESVPDTVNSYRWGAVYTGLIDLKEDGDWFPWNDPAARSFLTDRVSLMFEADFARYFNLFAKGATGMWGRRDADVYSSRFFIDQGHIAVNWNDLVAGKLFMRERVFRNRNRLMFLVSNDSPLISMRGEGLDASVLTAGPVHLSYTGAVFRPRYAQMRNFGFPAMPIAGEYLNVFEGGIKRYFWHAGLSLAQVNSIKFNDSALYGITGGFTAAGGHVNLEFSRLAPGWDEFEDGLFGFDFDAMKWGGFSAGLPVDGALAAEWTGLILNAGETGKFGITPGYRYSGVEFSNVFGEVPSGYVESYIETWWKHAKLASLVTVKAADRYDYNTGEGGGVLETSLWTRLKGGLETTARAFFTEGSRPVLIFSSVDDNKLTRLLTTARLDDTGGNSKFSFLTQAGVNLGRRWTLGGSLYLERSVEGFYSADLEMRGGKRFVFRASAGTFIPGSTWASLNFDPVGPVTMRDRVISFYTRISLGGI